MTFKRFIQNLQKNGTELRAVGKWQFAQANHNHDSNYILKSGDTMSGALTTPNLFVINDSCNTAYDVLAYFRHYSDNDWCVKIDTGSFNYGLNVITNESSAYGISCNSRITGNKVYGAVWNDYAEYRSSLVKEPGRCVYELDDDTLALTTKRLQKGCEIVSDTFGFAIGETKKCKTPIAVTSRVLAYPYESREEFNKHIGDCICSGPDCTVSIMTPEEEKEYPSCIIGTISAVPSYEEWGTGKVNINGRIWIRII